MTDQRGDGVRTTGIGSMPGMDSDEATRVVVGELSVPHLVELPARGPGGDMIGRTLALVGQVTGEFAGETTPTGWRLAGSRGGADRGRQMRRGSAWLAEDADRLEQHLAGFVGVLKIQVCGPWTLAATVESPSGTRLLADGGACRDLADALAAAVADHVRDVGRRIPGARVVVQLDEPSLPAVLAGRVRTASGRGALRVPDAPELIHGLAAPLGAARAAGCEDVAGHCCARDVPIDLLARAGFSAVSVDLGLLGRASDEALGAWWDRGGLVMLGMAPSLDPPAAAQRALPEAMARAVAALWDRIGFSGEQVGGRTWLTPTCGLAGASPGWSRAVGGSLAAAARLLASAD